MKTPRKRPKKPKKPKKRLLEAALRRFINLVLPQVGEKMESLKDINANKNGCSPTNMFTMICSEKLATILTAENLKHLWNNMTKDIQREANSGTP